MDKPLSLNLYGYCTGNPVMFMDPSGNRPQQKRGYPAYNRGNQEFMSEIRLVQREAYENGGDDVVSIIAGFTPADIFLDSAGLILGKDIITGDDTSRLVLLGCIFLPEVGDQLLKNGKKGYKIFKGASKSDELTSLFRAVGPDEFYDVMKTGEFSVIPQGLQAKQFGLSFDETLKFAEKYSDIGAILEIKVPTNMLNDLADFTQVDQFIFKNGTVTIHLDQLDDFNKIIKEINHKY